MKHIVLFTILLIFTTQAFGQSSKEIKKAKAEAEYKAVVDEIFGEDDEDFKIREIPEKWKNESGVIIAQKMLMDYRRKNSKYIYQTELARRMIKIQDQASQEEFSEFYYSAGKYVGIKVIKPNGDIIEVDRSEAVEVEEEVSGFFKSFSSGRYYKVAIPNLEPGDIIDFFYAIDNEIYAGDYESFDPVFITLENEYPVMKQVIDFTIDKDFYFNFNSYNGAPELINVKRNNQLDKKTRYKDRYIRAYVLEDHDREKEKSPRWYYPYRESPLIKFQVMYYKNVSSTWNSVEFVGLSGTPKHYVDSDEIGKLLRAASTFKREFYGIDRKAIKMQMKSSDEQKIEFAYYTLRNKVYANKFKSSGDWSQLNWRSYNEFTFISDLSALLTTLDVYNDIVYFVQRYHGTMDDVLLIQDISTAIKVIYKDEIMILRLFGPNTNLGDPTTGMESTDFVGLKNNFYEKKFQIDTSSHLDNKSLAEIKVSTNVNNDSLNFAIHNTFTGFNRSYEWNSVVTPIDWIQEDNEYLGYEPLTESAKPKKKIEQKLEARKKNVEKYLNDFDEKRKKSIESNLEIEIESYRNFKLIQSGRFHSKPELMYSEEFTTTDLIQKTGKNYLISIGQFIGSQIAIEKEEYERKKNVYMSNSRSFENLITFEILEGYFVDGIEDLNTDVTNETGSFKSEAKVEGNKLIVTTEKVYLNNYEPVENWPKMIEFLDAAYNFTQKKVVLKKK